jgi:hypothetical protein
MSAMENIAAQSSRAEAFARVIGGSIITAVSLLACGITAFVTLFFGSAHESVPGNPANALAPAGVADIWPTPSPEPSYTPLPTRTPFADSAARAATPTALALSNGAPGPERPTQVPAPNASATAVPETATAAPSPSPVSSATEQPPATGTPEPSPTTTGTPEPSGTPARGREVTASAPALNGQRAPRQDDILSVSAGGVTYAVRAYASVPLDNGDHGVALLLSVTGQTRAAIQRPRCNIFLADGVELTDSKRGLWPRQYSRSWTRIEAGRTEVDWMPIFIFDRRYASADLSGISCEFDDDDTPVRFTIRAPA